MSDFETDFMSDVPRGDTAQFLRQQSAPESIWMPLADIKRSAALQYDPMKPGKKILIGALGHQLIGIEDDRHIMTVAGSRSGKSVGLVSNMLFYRGSILATDPKGELARLTAKRRSAMGQRILVLDPFGVVDQAAAGWRASYNPMDVLDIHGATFLEDAALIAGSMVVQSADQKDPHWDESARNFIEGVIVHVATATAYVGKRHLVSVRGLLKQALKKTPASADDRPSAGTQPALYVEMLENAARLQAQADTEDIGEALVGAAEDFYSKRENELSGVLSTVNRHTKFLDYRAFRGVMQRSDFSLRDLKRNPSGVSLYLCFPATRADISRRWMRLFINQLLDAMEREQTVPEAPVLVCLDEFPVLGYMQQLETAAGLIASYGVKLWFVLQDFNQGKALYKERWETFVGNAGILQFFGNSDLTTTKYISERLGKTPVKVARMGEVAQEQQKKGLSGRSESVEMYDLLTPGEVSRQFARSDRLHRQLVHWVDYHPMMLQRVIHHDKNGPLAPFLI